MGIYPVHLRHVEATLARQRGSGSLESLFPEAVPKATVPWPRAPRLPDRRLFDRVAVEAEFEHQRPAVGFFDPATLWASQPGVTRAGVEYYLGLRWWITGETYADRHSLFNRLPVIEVRPDGKHVILNGHHRSCAALLQDRPVLGRCVVPDGPHPAERVDLRVPGLVVGPSHLGSVAVTVEETVEAIVSHQVAVVPDDEVASQVIEALQAVIGDER